jgi:thioredoxin reductase (NADPH)
LQREASGEYKVTAEDGHYVHGKYILIAAGAGMISPRKLELESAEKYLGKGFEYVVEDVEKYRGKKVLVIGGGDTALDWAYYFTAMSSEVTLIHRSTKFVGFEGSLIRLQKSSCKIFTDTKLAAMSGTDKLEGVTISNTKEGWSKEIEIDRLLGCIGFTPKLGFIKECGFEIAEGSIKSDSNMRTNVENVYAVGDISNHPGRIKLISTGFGNVQIALNNILSLEQEFRSDITASQMEKKSDHIS